VTTDRQHVIDVARTWLGTPFHDNAGLKGVGVDCAHLIARVFVEAEVVTAFVIEGYSPQHMLHSDNELFLGYVERFAHEIQEGDVQAGDIVLYQVGRAYAHGAIIVAWPSKIIHAFKTFRMVAETDGFEADLKGRKTRFFSIW
jgi:cell wall-associated NlpC family hydrolase